MIILLYRYQIWWGGAKKQRSYRAGVGKMRRAIAIRLRCRHVDMRERETINLLYVAAALARRRAEAVAPSTVNPFKQDTHTHTPNNFHD